jgi:predicted 3-demethylubiquinone-9 3-methyltransferase (glyoxalase superfamily)
MQKITPFLWFDNQAEEAVNFYVSIFPDGKLGSVSRYDKAGAEASGRKEGEVMIAEFEILGMKFLALNGGPGFKFSPAISFLVNCETQEEIDKLWSALSAVPESEQCGWLQDKFGVSWQIVPTILPKLLANEDKEKAARVMKAMLGMKKMNIEELKNA